ncbi:fungal specific transcription factor domain-containing protein [Aspergillus melleus]|uniref:fungal specific transcription factor domain-containing protein n=1 Tax=Aspergillus melleus TaxID=138277 RepID=UPI001E8D115E|nr:uncharacterized protein LDX57_010296 [Aspergillus melleus]KAH8432669.1 hypothetical protein LDX57_010296 [Aspergillus melleus]
MPSLTDDAMSWPEPEQLSTPGVAYDPMIQLYYQNFHRSHPLLVPRKALASNLADRIPPYLLSIMRYVGAHFYPDPAFKEEFRAQAYTVFADSTLRDGFKVQGMLLLAIVEHAHGQDDNAHRSMQAAIDLALDLGMHRSGFAVENSEGDFLMEESWCRTFWELYVVDGLLATMRDQSSFRLCRQRTDVRLPCAEDAFSSGIAVSSPFLNCPRRLTNVMIADADTTDPKRSRTQLVPRTGHLPFFLCISYSCRPKSGEGHGCEPITRHGSRSPRTDRRRQPRILLDATPFITRVRI